jgi:hypothetical protein
MSHQGRLPSVLEKPVGLKFHGDLNGRHALNELQFFGQGFFGAHRGGGTKAGSWGLPPRTDTPRDCLSMTKPSIEVPVMLLSSSSKCRTPVSFAKGQALSTPGRTYNGGAVIVVSLSTVAV